MKQFKSVNIHVYVVVVATGLQWIMIMKYQRLVVHVISYYFLPSRLIINFLILFYYFLPSRLIINFLILL